MKKILLLAAIIYFFIAPLTYHPDNKAVLFWASQDNGRVWNIWEYGEKNLGPKQQFNYPPLHFYLDKLQYLIAKPLGGADFAEWLGTPHEEDFFQPKLARFMMAAKAPLILFGLLAGFLIFLLAKQSGMTDIKSRLAAGLWLFNPITVYSIPMMGQNDVMAIVFFLCGWLLLKKYPVAAGVVFGLAASIKTYPLIWLLFLLPVTIGLSVKQKVGVFVLSTVVYGLTLVPFLHNQTFLSVGMNSEINNRFFIPQINIGFDQAIYLIPVLLSVVFLAAKASPAAVLMTVNLVLLGFSHFHPQWYLWVVPFFALWLPTLKNRVSIQKVLFLAFVSLGAWLMVILLFADKWLSTGMLSVANPYLGFLPVIRDFLSLRGISAGMYDNLAHSALAAVGVLSLILLVTKQQAEADRDELNLSFDGLRKIWANFSKPLRVIISALFFLLNLVLWVGVLQAIPAPASSAPLTGKHFVAIDAPVRKEILVDRNNFYRFDLRFSNPHMKNAKPLIVSLMQGDKLLHQQTISGMNIGEDNTIRFDLLSVQNISKGQTYSVILEPLYDKDTSPILVLGGTDNELEFSTQLFYKTSKSLPDLISRTQMKIEQIIGQVPWYYAGLFLLLCLWA